ncbi:hypothetical protein Ocin01_11115 [Orchesella cincta]|uniref:Uncharacterized protein n=1 Tax=Orchesella cincta TaxID=48709 RepID=A0A1D2MR39_ORCCI|nr:hypothetical protein Ocin01_11115 [Orchesella cincta]
MSDNKEVPQEQKEGTQNTFDDEEEEAENVAGPQFESEEEQDEEETIIPPPATDTKRGSKVIPQFEEEEEDGEIGEPVPPPLVAAGGYEEEEDEDGMQPGLMEQMFPEGVGDFEEGDEEGFREKYGLGDILGEIENEDLEEDQEQPTNDEDYIRNYEEFLGEDGPEGPTVEQLEAMIKYLDEQKQQAEPKEDNSEDLLPEKEVAKRHGRTPPMRMLMKTKRIMTTKMMMMSTRKNLKC